MKLHLGCGSKKLANYVHVDIADFPHIAHKKPIYPLDFIESGSVEEIYCSHALEYYDFHEALLVLKDWHRVLNDNGCLRLSVPDFDKLLKVYYDQSGNIDSIIGPIFGRWSISADYIYHRTVYNKKKLTELLSIVGYHNIKDWEPLEFFGKDSNSFDDYSKAFHPKMDFEKGFPISINFLAFK
tara:strand:- start:762 stop:1310 length:549 start_codon:yes stop_codon:yes gene_type:complete